MWFFFFTATATTEIYTLSLHDALPISRPPARDRRELSTAQVQRELPGPAGPARGDGEPHRGRVPGLERGAEPLQRLHPAFPAGVDGQGARQGTALVLRAAGAGSGADAEG